MMKMTTSMIKMMTMMMSMIKAMAATTKHIKLHKHYILTAQSTAPTTPTTVTWSFDPPPSVPRSITENTVLLTRSVYTETFSGNGAPSISFTAEWRTIFHGRKEEIEEKKIIKGISQRKSFRQKYLNDHSFSLYRRFPSVFRRSFASRFRTDRRTFVRRCPRWSAVESRL